MLTEIKITKKRQKELEKLDYHLIRINPDKPNFDDYEEFGTLSAYIAESIKNQTCSFEKIARIKI